DGIRNRRRSSGQLASGLMLDTPPPLPLRQPIWQLLLGVVISNLTGSLLLFGVVWFVGAYKGRDFTVLIAWPSFFLIPFVMGLAAAWPWRSVSRTLGWRFLDALWVTLAGRAAAARMLRDAVVSLVI